MYRVALATVIQYPSRFNWLYLMVLVISALPGFPSSSLLSHTVSPSVVGSFASASHPSHLTRTATGSWEDHDDKKPQLGPYLEIHPTAFLIFSSQPSSS